MWLIRCDYQDKGGERVNSCVLVARLCFTTTGAIMTLLSHIVNSFNNFVTAVLFKAAIT